MREGFTHSAFAQEEKEGKKEPSAVVEGGTRFFEHEEEGFLKDAVKKIERRGWKKLGGNTARLLAAAAVFMSASSAFVKEVSAEEIAEEFAEHKKPYASLEVPREESFDVGKIIERLEISVSGEQKEIDTYAPNATDEPYWSTQQMRVGLRQASYDADKIDFFINKALSDTHAHSEFYHEAITAEEYKGVYLSFERFVSDALTIDGFFASLGASSREMNNDQKLLFLQLLGNALARSYNYDMANAKQTVKMGGDVMLAALRAAVQGTEIPPTGICGNIHVFLVKSAEALGIEAWLQEGMMQKEGHIWAGAVRESDDGKEIVFFNYGTIIPTGTLNYGEAIGIAERYFGRVDLFGSSVGNTEEVLFPVLSAAHKKMKEAAGVKDIGERMEGLLDADTLEGKEKTLEIKVSPGTKEIAFSGDTLGVAVFNFEDKENPYQSLEELNALRGSVRLHGEHAGLEAGTTILHASLKDFFKRTADEYRQFDEVVSNLAVDYINSHRFAKGDFGEFSMRYGATVQSAVGYLLEQKTYRTKNEIAAGAQIAYANPENTGKFYVGWAGAAQAQLSDFERQETVMKEISRTLTLGAELTVHEANIVNLEAAQSVRQWGERTQIKGDVAGEKFSGRIEYEKDTSRYGRFYPDKEKIGTGVTYKGGPKWEIDIFGTKTTERYADADPKESAGAEIKLKIFLW